MTKIVIFAGPGGIGKSTFINSICSEKLIDVNQSLGIDRPFRWKVLDSSHLDGVEIPSGKDILLHHTIPIIPWTNGLLNRGDPDLRLSPFTGEEDVTCVTFLADPKTLKKRLRRKRLRTVAGSIARIDHRRLIDQIGRIRLLEKIYSDTGQVVAIYKRWFDESSQFLNRRIISWENGQEPRLRSVNDWNEIVSQWRAL